MADSQVEEQQSQSQPAGEEPSSGIFSSGFSKIGAALPNFSMPWGNKTEEVPAEVDAAAAATNALPDGDSKASAEVDENKGGFLSGVSGGFSKLAGGLPSVTVPSFSMPWSKKEGDQPVEAQEATETLTPTPTQPSEEKSVLAGVSGGFSKLTGNLPSVSVPSFGLPSMPWSKKEGDQAANSEVTASNSTDEVTKSESLADGSINAVKAGADKFSSAVTGIFGVFKSNDQDASANVADDSSPK